MRYLANLIVRTFRVLTAQFGLWLFQKSAKKIQVEIVHCRECEFYDGPGHMHWCRKMHGNHPGDWFCADGKREIRTRHDV